MMMMVVVVLMPINRVREFKGGEFLRQTNISFCPADTPHQIWLQFLFREALKKNLVTAEQEKMRSQLVAQFMPFFRLIVHIF